MESPIPQISISLAPPEEIPEEPCSPFSPSAWTVIPDSDEDGFRPQHLSPLSAGSPRFPKVLSPLRPADAPVKGAGLERERFEALLKASKERSSATGSRKAADLRKEVALKAHKSKHIDRRALFLSKLQAPPSPSAATTPKTPPDSPAIFHYTLPSPGLNSPLSLFDAVSGTSEDTGITSVQPWTEEVDFRYLDEKPIVTTPKPARPRPLSLNTPPTGRKPLPSLDQITAHLSSHGHMPAQHRAETPRPAARLPAFLQTSVPAAEVAAPAEAKPRRLPIGVGRLQMPARPVPPPAEAAPARPVPTIPTIVVASPTDRFDTAPRARTAKCMLSTLRRRTASYSFSQCAGACELPVPAAEDPKERRRRSSPAELQQSGKPRLGFMHPVLRLPGGF